MYFQSFLKKPSIKTEKILHEIEAILSDMHFPAESFGFYLA